MSQCLSLRDYVECNCIEIDADIFTLLWQLVEGDEWIRLERDIIVKYMSPSGKDGKDVLNRFYTTMLPKFKLNVDYKPIDRTNELKGRGRPSRIYMVTKNMFVALLCKSQNPMSMRVLEYFCQLQSLVVKYYKHQAGDYAASLKSLLEIPHNVEYTASQERKYAEQNVDETGFIYFIYEDGDQSCFKIGFSKDVEIRLGDLQVGNKRKLICYRTISTTNMFEDEKYLHNYHKSVRIHGEWFKLTAAEVDATCDHMLEQALLKCIVRDV